MIVINPACGLVTASHFNPSLTFMS